ncbi:hypothetical protein FHL15_009482 [Xylaria flabelliformis]|uniref:Rhodopsin domain-containing protein n=1 Tax=Xylaria flabelliformis TaxID=2512241 RepID=A0A553HNM7_9PEZI|nr:hypothetical protein FHL15_009482 [Xylaria flabelliformis]
MSLEQISSLPPAQQQAILNGPALAPPAGVVPNLDNPPNSNVLCLIIMTIFLVIATLVFTLAVYAKLFYIKKLHVEDCKTISVLNGKENLGYSLTYLMTVFAFAGFALYVALQGCVFSLIAQFGLFVHQWDIRVKDLAGIFYLAHVASELYAVCIVLIKSAILLEWVRIFVPRATRGAFYWICHILLWTNVVFYTVILISANLSCTPFARIWDKTLPGNCSTDNNAYDVATASFNFVSDVLIFLLPQRMIWRLHLKTKKKIGIAFIFAIGISACTAAAYRLYASTRFLEKSDETYIIGDVALGAEAETMCAILIFYVPTLPKAFKHVKSPFKFLNSVFSRGQSYIGTSYIQPSVDSSGHVELGVLHPPRAHIPQMSILRTTQISLNRGTLAESGSTYL